MKKILCSLLLMVFTIIPVNVFAAGYISVSPTTITVTEGSTKTITITAYNSVGDVSIKSNKNKIATVDNNSWETGPIGSNETITGEITIKGIKKGKTKITFTVDGATFDGETLKGQVHTIDVKVVKDKNSSTNDNNFIKILIIMLIIIVTILVGIIIKNRIFTKDKKSNLK